jgi:hypothetical protein
MMRPICGEGDFCPFAIRTLIGALDGFSIWSLRISIAKRTERGGRMVPPVTLPIRPAMF